MKPPQHHRKRGYRKTLASVLRHVEAGRCGYDDALWLYYHIADLRRQADIHRKDNELMLRVLAKERQEVWDLRDENARLRAVLETRQATVGALAYALEGLVKDATLTHEERIEMANRWLAHRRATTM